MGKQNPPMLVIHWLSEGWSQARQLLRPWVRSRTLRAISWPCHQTFKSHLSTNDEKLGKQVNLGVQRKGDVASRIRCSWPQWQASCVNSRALLTQRRALRYIKVTNQGQKGDQKARNFDKYIYIYI